MNKNTIAVSNVPELQEAKTYFQQKGINSLNASELNTDDNQGSNPNTQQPTNWIPWIVGGGVILVLGIVIVYFLMKNKKKEA